MQGPWRTTTTSNNANKRLCLAQSRNEAWHRNHVIETNTRINLNFGQAWPLQSSQRSENYCERHTRTGLYRAVLCWLYGFTTSAIALSLEILGAAVHNVRSNGRGEPKTRARRSIPSKFPPPRWRQPCVHHAVQRKAKADFT